MTAIAYQPVPRLWPGETIVCAATGPSLTVEDLEYCRGRGRVIVIKQAMNLAPWADVLYACDGTFWKKSDTSGFRGLKYALDQAAAPWAQVLKNTGEFGLEIDPCGLRTGRNSGAQAINLAYHLVGDHSRIVLLGYDQQPGMDGRNHFFGEHWNKAPNYRFPDLFARMVAPLQSLGIRVLNATRRTALTCFERCSLTEALA